MELAMDFRIYRFGVSQQRDEDTLEENVAKE